MIQIFDSSFKAALSKVIQSIVDAGPKKLTDEQFKQIESKLRWAIIQDCNDFFESNPEDPADSQLLFKYGYVPRIIEIFDIKFDIVLPRAAYRTEDGSIRTHVLLPQSIVPYSKKLSEDPEIQAMTSDCAEPEEEASSSGISHDIQRKKPEMIEVLCRISCSLGLPEINLTDVLESIARKTKYWKLDRKRIYVQIGPPPAAGAVSR